MKIHNAFLSIQNEKEFYNFFNDICTPTEIREITERWNIVQLLATTEMSQLAISKKLNCSVTTVTRVARFLNDEKNGGYISVLKKLYPGQITARAHR
jgi:TrpR-related protein YerC/YecD